MGAGVWALWPSLGEAGLGAQWPVSPVPGAGCQVCRGACALSATVRLSRSSKLSRVRALASASLSVALWDGQRESHQSRSGLRDELFLASVCLAARQRYRLLRNTPNISVTAVLLFEPCSSSCAALRWPPAATDGSTASLSNRYLSYLLRSLDP